MQLTIFLLLIFVLQPIIADNVSHALSSVRKNARHPLALRRYKMRQLHPFSGQEDILDDEEEHEYEYEEEYGHEYEVGPCPDGMTLLMDQCFSSENVCYAQTNVGFPFNCKYFDYLKAPENLMPLETSQTFRYLAKRNPHFGYYEITEPGSQFRRLVTGFEAGMDWQPCAIGSVSHSEECEFELFTIMASCDDTTIDGICFYDGSRYNFCENFLEICESDCDCVDYRGDFKCEQTGGCGPQCKECVDKFESYPPPVVTLQSRGPDMYVVVRNALKIANMFGPELHCFSENNESNDEAVWKKHQLTPSFEFEDTIIRQIETYQGGLFWCEYFTYPNMELMRSNDAVLLHEGVFSFILNVTVDLEVGYFTFIPYNIVTVTVEKLLQLLSVGLDRSHIFIVKIYPMTSVNDRFQKLTYRINKFTEEDAELLQDSIQWLIDSLPTFETHVVSLSLAPADRCLATTDKETNISFPTIGLGRVAVSTTSIVDSNGLPIRRRCLGSYVTGGFWGDFDKITSVGEKSSITDDLNGLLASDISAKQLNEDLFNLIEGSEEDVIPLDVYLISEILTRIVSSNETFDRTIFTNIMNEVMRFPTPVLSQAQQSLNATDVILYNYDLMLGGIANSDFVKSKMATIIQSDLILAQIANIETTGINGMAVFKRNDSFVIESLARIQSFDQISFTDLVFATFLPEDFLDYLERNYEYEIDMHLVTALYLNDALFDPENSDRVATYTVSTFVPNFNSFLLSASIPTYFNVEGSKPTCAFWRYGLDEQLAGIFGSWEYQNESLDPDTYRICNFEHMTHFALLINAPSDHSLHIFNRITSIASVIGTAIIIITAVVFSNWREQAGTVVLLNYTVAVLVQHLLLLLFDIFPEEGSPFCKAVGILIHYIMLVQFFWTLVISYVQYLKLVIVFGKQPVNIVLKSCLLSWFGPMILVGIVAGVAVEDYNCLITGYSFYFGLLLPISLIIVINFVFFGRILHSLFCSKIMVPVKSNEYHKVSVSIILFFLMGFTWVFGLMANFLDSIVFSYIFSAFTGSHGLILCVYFILLQKQTRSMWMEKICKCCGMDYYNKSSVSSTKTS